MAGTAAVNSIVSPTLVPGMLALGVPAVVVAVSLLVDASRQRQWNRERLLLGRDFALAALAVGALGCLIWMQRYLEAVREAAGRPGGALGAAPLAGPEEATLLGALAVLAMAGAALVVVRELMAPYLRNKAIRPRAEPAISYRRLAAINALGLLPLLMAALLLDDGW